MMLQRQGRGLWMALGLALVAGGPAGCASMGEGSDVGQIERSTGKNRQAAEVNTELASGYMREGELKVAMEKVKRAIAFDGSYAAAHHVHALLLDRLGEEEEAGEAYRKAHRFDRDNPGIANNYAGYLCRVGEYERAQALFRSAYEDPLYETREYALVNSGRCYQRAGESEKALEQFRRAIDAGSNQPVAVLGMARALHEQGESEEAARVMERYESRFRHTPESLATAIEIDKAVGDDAALANHRLILRGRFPDSPEAKEQQAGGSQ
ncbi:type IV pilus biogenesis/stability protein PilW [Guyparkeria sp.]|uniref:type IV pilus biogenesis/stability protein PilW n=1 Tax=Guyparkeria sp. TaxID=2035736 RepID=UPI00356B2F7B